MILPFSLAVESACDRSHCSGVCLPLERDGFTCACGVGKKLAADERTCTGRLQQFSTTDSDCFLSVVECRSLYLYCMYFVFEDLWQNGSFFNQLWHARVTSNLFGITNF